MTGRELTGTRFDLENVLGEDLLLERLVLSRSTSINPRLHLDFRVVGELETPVSLHSTNILDGNSDPSGVFTLLGRDLSKVPRELFKVGS